MIDLSLLIDQSYGGFFVASMAVIAVAISKAGFGGAMASLSAPIMLLAFTPSQSLVCCFLFFWLQIFGLSGFGGI